MALPSWLAERLGIPLIAAPMTGVSGPALVTAACRAGVIGSFPTHNAGTVEELDRWLRQITNSLDAGSAAPVAPNLVVHRTNTRLHADVECLIRHRVELVITSVGAPDAVIEPLHASGCLVFTDVATLRHVERAIAAGADGLVLLTAGAGGQTGHVNPFAFVRAVRERFSGPVVLAGGVADGASLAAAEVLGADLAYMGTRFIATEESLAGDDYRTALVNATLDDVTTSTVPSGLPANFLTEWFDRHARNGRGTPAADGFRQQTLLDAGTVWAAGHSVSGVEAVEPIDDLIADIGRQYRAARARLLEGEATDTYPSAARRRA